MTAETSIECKVRYGDIVHAGATVHGYVEDRFVRVTTVSLPTVDEQMRPLTIPRKATVLLYGREVECRVTSRTYGYIGHEDAPGALHEAFHEGIYPSYPNQTPCVRCEEVYSDGVNVDGLCGSCVNLDRGLCRCGDVPVTGEQCGACHADERADALFHADR